MSRIPGIATALLLHASLSQAQASAGPSIEGAWKVAERVVTGANASTNTNPLPSLYIFGKRHYTQLIVNGTQPRAAVAEYQDAANPTDAEKLARFAHWNPFTANGGTYEITGSTLTRRPLVAKNESVMAGSPTTVEFRLDGNSTLWIISKSAAGQPVSETRTKLTRLE